MNVQWLHFHGAIHKLEQLVKLCSQGSTTMTRFDMADSDKGQQPCYSMLDLMLLCQAFSVTTLGQILRNYHLSITTRNSRQTLDVDVLWQPPTMRFFRNCNCMMYWGMGSLLSHFVDYCSSVIYFFFLHEISLHRKGGLRGKRVTVSSLDLGDRHASFFISLKSRPTQ